MKNADKKTISIYFLLLFGIIIYVSLIFNDNLWVDEAFTAALVRGSWGEVWHDTVADTLPPFYNLFAKGMTEILGYSAPVMKLASVIPMILTLIMAAFPFKKLFGAKASALFIMLLISMPFMLYYGVEIRPYSWGFFFASAAACSYCSVIRNFSKTNITFLAIFTALSGYAHHFSLIASGILWVWLFIYVIISHRESIAAYFKGILLTTIIYLPCFCLAVYQIKNASSYFSMSPLSLHSLLSDIRYPFVTNITLLSASLLAIFVICVLSGLLLHDQNTLPAISLIAVFFAVIGFGYGASALKGSSIFTARYLFPSLGAFWMGVSLLLENLLRHIPKKQKSLITSVLFVIIILTGSYGYYSQFKSEYDTSVNHMKECFAANIKPDDGYIIYESAYQIETCMKYYYPDLKKYSWKNADKIKGTAWYFEVEGYEDKLKKASEHGYKSVFIDSLAFDRYSFKLYRLDKE